MYEERSQMLDEIYDASLAAARDKLAAARTKVAVAKYVEALSLLKLAGEHTRGALTAATVGNLNPAEVRALQKDIECEWGVSTTHIAERLSRVDELEARLDGRISSW
jgi:hypothetical protein